MTSSISFLLSQKSNLPSSSKVKGDDFDSASRKAWGLAMEKEQMTNWFQNALIGRGSGFSSNNEANQKEQKNSVFEKKSKKHAGYVELNPNNSQNIWKSIPVESSNFSTSAKGLSSVELEKLRSIACKSKTEFEQLDCCDQKIMEADDSSLNETNLTFMNREPADVLFKGNMFDESPAPIILANGEVNNYFKPHKDQIDSLDEIKFKENLLNFANQAIKEMHGSQTAPAQSFNLGFRNEFLRIRLDDVDSLVDMEVPNLQNESRVPNAEKASFTEEIPLRIHTEWTDSGVKIWLGMNQSSEVSVMLFSIKLKQWLIGQKIPLISLICNGQKIGSKSNEYQITDTHGEISDFRNSALKIQMHSQVEEHFLINSYKLG